MEAPKAQNSNLAIAPADQSDEYYGREQNLLHMNTSRTVLLII